MQHLEPAIILSLRDESVTNRIKTQQYLFKNKPFLVYHQAHYFPKK
jgi:hypothetical protein